MPNNLAIAADTSSPAAATILVVEVAAAASAAMIASPIPVKSAHAAVKASGAAITYDDIAASHHLRHSLQYGQPSWSLVDLLEPLEEPCQQSRECFIGWVPCGHYC